MRSGLMLMTALAVLLGGCQTNGNSAQNQKAALTLSGDALAQRQIQMRRFDTTDELRLLSAATGVMQDLGFTIEETMAGTGIVIGAKDRDAVEAGQMAGQLFFAALIAAAGGKANPSWDATQKIRLSVATKPSTETGAMVARVTFQRVVWNQNNQLTKLETISDPLIYRQFFDRLAQSVFLEAHEI